MACRTLDTAACRSVSRFSRRLLRAQACSICLSSLGPTDRTASGAWSLSSTYTW